MHRFQLDLNRNGVVEIQDLLELLRNYPYWTKQDIDIPDLLGAWGDLNPAGEYAKYLFDVATPNLSDYAQVILNEALGPVNLCGVQHAVFRNCVFNGGGEYLVLMDENTSDIIFDDCKLTGTGDTKIGFDGYRGPSRVRMSNCTVTGCQYGAYMQGKDIEIINCNMKSSRSEHALRIANAQRVNVVGGSYIRSDKTAVTVRRFVDNCAVINVDTIGQLSIGPDPRYNSTPDWCTKSINVVGCVIDTNSTSDRPVVVYPKTDLWNVHYCKLWDSDTASRGRGYLVQVDQREIKDGQVRRHGYGSVKTNLWNGVENTGNVDGPGITVLSADDHVA